MLGGGSGAVVALHIFRGKSAGPVSAYFALYSSITVVADSRRQAMPNCKRLLSMPD